MFLKTGFLGDCDVSAAGPGILAARAPPPGWRRHRCKRPLRTGRTARSRRSATRRPHRASPVRSRRGRQPRPAPHTGTSCCPGRGRRTRAGTVRVALQAQRVSPAGPAPVQRVRGNAEEHLAGESVVPRVQSRKLARQLEGVTVSGEHVEQDTASGDSVISGRRACGRQPVPVPAAAVPAPRPPSDPGCRRGSPGDDGEIVSPADAGAVPPHLRNGDQHGRAAGPDGDPPFGEVGPWPGRGRGGLLQVGRGTASTPSTSLPPGWPAC